MEGSIVKITSIDRSVCYDLVFISNHHSPDNIRVFLWLLFPVTPLVTDLLCIRDASQVDPAHSVLDLVIQPSGTDLYSLPVSKMENLRFSSERNAFLFHSVFNEGAWGWKCGKHTVISTHYRDKQMIERAQWKETLVCWLLCFEMM